MAVSSEIGDIGEEKLESFNWTDDNFYNPDEILEKLQQVIQPSTIAQSNKYKKRFNYIQADNRNI